MGCGVGTSPENSEMIRACGWVWGVYYVENGENGLGLFLGCLVGTPSENCEKGLSLWPGCGVLTPNENGLGVWLEWSCVLLSK